MGEGVVKLINGKEYIFTGRIDSREEWVPLAIVEHTPQGKEYYVNVWKRMAYALDKFHNLAEDPGKPGWVNWKPDEWCDQVIEDRQRFIAWSGKELGTRSRADSDRFMIVAAFGCVAPPSSRDLFFAIEQ